jgi:diaminohydroxyphosphoribosylaminopyrimidine deaminase / 5-amino-6-(5-phosphoribosylamino)uracil reductase
VTTEDEQFLRRAIRLAMNGRGSTEPNPSVGCVIVKNGRVLGEGHTQPFGGAHAEPTALANCTEDPAGATAYVTLEPCCHTNKKTPPCTPRLIAAKIARVVSGCLDPNPDVNGKGLAQLRAAGIEVTEALLEAECQQLIAPFIARTNLHRPYITLKWAQSADGKIAGANRHRRQISGPAAVSAVYELRARCDAILVGVGTVLSDDPLLTARNVKSSRLHNRIILDSRLRTPPDSQLARTAHQGLVDLYYTPSGFLDASEMNRITPLLNAGINLFVGEEKVDGRIQLGSLFENDHLGEVTHLLVEPGPTLAEGFFSEGLADRVWLVKSSRAMQENGAIDAPMLPSQFVKSADVRLGDDLLTEYLNTEGPLFFAAVPSADFNLAAEQSSRP